MVNVICRLMAAAKKCGVESAEFVGHVDETMDFLQKDPVVKVPVLPDFARTSRTKLQVQRAPLGAEFWRLLTCDNLGAQHMTLASMDALQKDLQRSGRGGGQASI